MSENDTTKSEAWENLVALGATRAAVEPVGRQRAAIPLEH